MLAGKILEIFSINPISPIKTPNRAKNHWLFFLCMSDAFSQAWSLLKGKDPVAEFGGNTTCPDCGSEMKQTKASLGFGYPFVYGFGCPKCGSFRPHDPNFAQKPESAFLCPECKGTGEQEKYNRKRESYECEMCDGTGRGER